MSGRLYRSRADRMLAGVCGGLADYFEVDPTLVRVVYAVVTVLTGVLGGLVLYVLLAVIMPVVPSSDSNDVTVSSTGRFASAGLVLVILGVLLLVANYGVLAWWTWARMWPVILIVGGVVLLLRGRS